MRSGERKGIYLDFVEAYYNKTLEKVNNPQRVRSGGQIFNLDKWGECNKEAIGWKDRKLGS
jgi:hypothetical protein